jgi:hypothetical protein
MARAMKYAGTSGDAQGTARLTMTINTRSRESIKVVTVSVINCLPSTHK